MIRVARAQGCERPAERAMSAGTGRSQAGGTFSRGLSRRANGQIALASLPRAGRAQDRKRSGRASDTGWDGRSQAGRILLRSIRRRRTGTLLGNYRSAQGDPDRDEVLCDRDGFGDLPYWDSAIVVPVVSNNSAGRVRRRARRRPARAGASRGACHRGRHTRAVVCGARWSWSLEARILCSRTHMTRARMCA